MIETIVTVVILCNNFNWEYSERCNAPVETIEIVDNGFEGYLKSGVFWEQKWITEDMMKFTMEDVCYYITQNLTFYCE